MQGVRGTGPRSLLPRSGTMRITTRTRGARGVTRKWGLVAGVRGSRRPGQGSPRTANAILLPAAWGDHPWGRNHPHPGGEGRCRRSAVPERDRLDLERDRPILERIGISPQDVLGGLSDTYGVRSGTRRRRLSGRTPQPGVSTHTKGRPVARPGTLAVSPARDRDSKGLVAAPSDPAGGGGHDPRPTPGTLPPPL